MKWVCVRFSNFVTKSVWMNFKNPFTSSIVCLVIQSIDQVFIRGWMYGPRHGVRHTVTYEKWTTVKHQVVFLLFQVYSIFYYYVIVTVGSCSVSQSFLPRPSYHLPKDFLHPYLPTPVYPSQTDLSLLPLAYFTFLWDVFVSTHIRVLHLPRRPLSYVQFTSSSPLTLPRIYGNP